MNAGKRDTDEASHGPVYTVRLKAAPYHCICLGDQLLITNTCSCSPLSAQLPPSLGSLVTYQP